MATTAVLRSAGERDRLAVAGGRYERRADVMQVVPELSRKDFENIRFGVLPHNAELEGMIADVYPPGSREAAEFFSHRKVVVREGNDGARIASVTSNVWEAVNTVQVVPLSLHERPVAGRGQRRVYELAQILTDPFLIQKFQLEPRVVSTAKTMAVVDANGSATYLQAAIRENRDFAKYEVTAGRYARSRKWAKDSINGQVTSKSLVPAHVECALIGEKLFLYGPGPESSRWSVFGPMWLGSEMRALYSVVLRAGPAQTCFAFGTEITVLDIDITDKGVVLSPSVELHAGPQCDLPHATSVHTASLLSAEGVLKVSSMRRSIEPVFVDGEQCACAVRVSRRHVLVNAHVIDSGAQVRVGEVLAKPQRLISRDLWLVEARNEFFEMEWSLRDAVKAEQVVVCYLKGNAVQCTAPMSVRNADESMLITSMTMDLQPGMSGGAVIALRDMSLLGVYSGVSSQLAVTGVFSQSHYVDLCTEEDESESSRARASGASGSVYTALKDRGLGRVLDRAVEVMEPIYKGTVHVGMGYHHKGQLRTTCDVRDTLVVGTARRGLEFSPAGDGLYAASTPNASPKFADGPMLVRKPQWGESVFVVGRDDAGPYVSKIVKVLHLGLGAKTFVIGNVTAGDSLPLAGGLVVAVSDASVVGQFRSGICTEVYGLATNCVGIPGDAGAGSTTWEEVRDKLKTLFPMLNPKDWPDSLIEECFTHSSAQGYTDTTRLFNVGNAPLAYVGDAIAKVRLGLSMRSAGVAKQRWEKFFQGLQTDSKCALVAEEFGLADMIVVGNGVSLARGCKAHSTVLEALVAVVYLQETTSVLEEFLCALGLVPREYSSGDLVTVVSGS